MFTRALLFAVVLGGLAACRREPAPPAPELPAVTVRTGVVARRSTGRFERLAGTVRPRDRALISAQATGVVASRPPALGTRVAAGELLLELTAPELLARLAQARAQLSQVERELARERNLLAREASTADAVRLLEDRQRAADAAVAEAAALAAYTRLTAPFPGVVTRRFVETGDLAVPGIPLLELEGTDRLRVEFAVPESLADLALNLPLTVEAGGRPLTGRLAELSPAAEPATRTRQARVELSPGADVRSGQFVRVLWPVTPTGELLTAPTGAITRFGQMEQVFVVEAGRARLRLVRTGEQMGAELVVLSGLAEGESVVLDPPPTLRDGQPLEVRR